MANSDSRADTRGNSITYAPRSGWGLCWILLLIPILLILLIWGGVVLTNYFGGDHPLTRHVDRTLLFKGQSLDVGLEFALGDADTTEIDVDASPVDLMICVDISGSMGHPRDSSSGLYHARRTLQALFAVFASTSRRIGVLEFSGHPSVLSPITADQREFMAGLQKLGGGGGTDIERAMRKGQEMLDDAPLPGARRLLVLISDGQDNNVSGCQQVAEQAAASQITCVGIGVGYTSDEEFFRTVFSPPHLNLGCYGNPQDLAPLVFSFVGNQGLLPVGASNAGLREWLNTAAFDFDSTASPFLIDRAAEDERVERLHFEIPVLVAGRNRLPYTIKACRIGVNRIAPRPAQLAYSPEPGQISSAQSGITPRVLVLSGWLLFWLYLPALLWLLWMMAHRIPILHKPQKSVAPPVPTPRLAPLGHVAIPSVVQEPALILALGGKGLEVAAHLKHTLREMMPREKASMIRVVGLDTDRESEPPEVMGTGLSPEDRIQTPSSPGLDGWIREAEQRPEEHPYLQYWFPYDTYLQRGAAANSLESGSAGDRRLVRAGFLRSLQADDKSVADLKEIIRTSVPETGQYQILIAASLEGGTGSGLLFDLANAVHCWCADQNLRTPPTVISFLLPGDVRPETAGNVRAALDELERFQQVRGRPVRMPRLSLAEPWDLSYHLRQTPLFDRVYLFHQNQSAADASDVLFLYCERSQRANLRELMHDGEQRVRQQALADGLPRAQNASVRSIRFVLGDLIERLMLTTLQGVVAQLCDVDAIAQPTEDDPTTWIRGPVDDWSEHDLYGALADRSDAEALQLWHRYLIGLGGDVIPPSGELDRVSAFYREAAPLFLNGFMAGEGEEAIRQAVRRRPNRLLELRAFLRCLGARGRELLEKDVLDEAQQAYLAHLNHVHEGLLDHVDLWTSILVGDPTLEIKDNADPTAGLYRFAQVRVEQLLEIESESGRLNQRTYLGDENGNPELSSSRLFDSRVKEPQLERGELLRRFVWELDDRDELHLHFFGLKEARLDVARDAGTRLLARFEALFDAQTLPDLWNTSLAHKLESGTVSVEQELAAYAADINYAILTVPDIHRWHEFIDLQQRVRQLTAIGRYLREARIDNPLWLSMTVVDPNVVIRQSDTYERASGALREQPPRPLPYVFRVEKVAVDYAEHIARARNISAPKHMQVAEVRAIFEEPGTLRALVVLLAKNQIRCHGRGPLSAWGIEHGGAFHPLQAWGRPAWLTACQRFVSEGFFWDGTPIPEVLFRQALHDVDRDALDSLAHEALGRADSSELTAEERGVWELIATEAMIALEES